MVKIKCDKCGSLEIENLVVRERKKENEILTMSEFIKQIQRMLFIAGMSNNPMGPAGASFIANLNKWKIKCNKCGYEIEYFA